MTDDWWEQPGNGGDTPVIRHAPDDNQYHLASDPDMIGKMRGSLVGRFAIIPAANKDGASKAFDPSVAGPVHVDPGAPDGGVVFDPTQVRKSDVEAAVTRAHYPHQVFYALGQSARELGIDGRGSIGRAVTGNDALPRTNSRLPGTYIAPQSSGDGRQVYASPNIPYVQENSTMAAPNLGQLPPLPAAGPSPVSAQAPAMGHTYGQPPAPQPYPPQPYPPQPQPYPPPYGYPPAQPDQNMQAMMNAIVGLQQQVQAIATARVVPPPAPATQTGYADNRGAPPIHVSSVPVEMRQRAGTPPRRQPPHDDDDYADETARPIRRAAKRQQPETADDEEPRGLLSSHSGNKRQTVKEYEESVRDAPEAVITGFETLNLSWLNGPLPGKPRRKVFFDIPGGGTHSAMYHDIIVTDVGDVVLVYDTRYEEGTQFLPPTLGPEIAISLSIQAPKKTESIVKQVCSLGLNFQFGVFDMIVLVKKPGEEVE